jgi:hypothetical protein
LHKISLQLESPDEKKKKKKEEEEEEEEERRKKRESSVVFSGQNPRARRLSSLVVFSSRLLRSYSPV